MASLSLVNVCKTYKNGFEAVKDVNLDIRDKEFLILVGPSGCGKSTTLRMIAGLEDISSGQLWIDGQLVNMLEPKNRDLSMVFQNYALYPHMTVYQNMAFGLKVRKTPKEEIDRRVRQAAKILDIAHLLDRKPHALSGGQKQRVAIGSVIVREPKAYLMDEPLSNLDAKLRSQMRVELSKLHRELGATVIYVTHDQVEAMTLGTRIVVMRSGKIQQAAAPGDLYQNPVNKFVAGFIGSPAMNFLPAWVERTARVAVNIVAAFVILLPLFYAVSIAFMPSSELFTTELNLFPSSPTMDNFKEAMRKIPLGRFILNSFIVAGAITFGQIISCSLAAFSFSFLDFKGKNVLFMIVMATMMIPGEATIISNYLTVSRLKWLDSYQVLIIPYLTSAMGIFLFRQFYMTFPISLYESAKIDGCSNIKFIFRILIPLTKAAIGAMAVYTFINAWNMYMWPLLVTGSDSMRTVQIGIGMLDSVDSQSISMMIAGVVMIIIPSISVFLIGQKQLIHGMFSGAVKG